MVDWFFGDDVETNGWRTGTKNIPMRAVGWCPIVRLCVRPERLSASEAGWGACQGACGVVLRMISVWLVSFRAGIDVGTWFALAGMWHGDK
jgi:hypothetical protein